MKNKLVLLFLGIVMLLGLQLGFAQLSPNSDYYEINKLLYTLNNTPRGEDYHLARIDGLLKRMNENLQLKDKVKDAVIRILTTGCKEAYYQNYSIFVPKRKILCRNFFKILERHNIHPGALLTDEVLALNDLSQNIYTNQEFIDYSKKNKSIGLQEKVLFKLDRLNINEVKQYFKIFAYALAVFNEEVALQNFQKKYLHNENLNAYHIRDIYTELHSNWGNTHRNLRQEILAELSNRVYNLPVKDWVAIGEAVVIELATYSTLYSSKDFSQKIIDSMKRSWNGSHDNINEQIHLLIHFLKQDDLRNYQEIYRDIESYFRHNLERFLYLHGIANRSSNTQSDLLSLLNKNKSNFKNSIDILTSFCGKSRNWSYELYTVVKDKYYPVSPDQVFENLLRPIYLNLRSHDAVYQYFAWDVYQGNILQKKHKLDVARYFLNKDFKERLTLYDPSSYRIFEIKNITFVTSIYLKYYDGTLDKDATIFYLNSILPELTNKIAEYLFVDRELIIEELKNVLSVFKDIHLRFPDLDYRKMKALMDINNKVKQEFETTLRDTQLASEMKKRKLVTIIQLMILTADILKDEAELSYIVERLRIDIFEFDNRVNRYSCIRLSDPQLHNRIESFASFDKDLRSAAKDVRNKTFLAKLYLDFYIPLIRIEGFLDQIYEYEKEERREYPYKDLLGQLSSDVQKASLDSLNRLLTASGYLKVEASLKPFLAYYYQLLGTYLWQEPETFQGNENANLWVFNYLLEQQLKSKKLSEDNRYKEILDIFLTHLGDLSSVDKTSQELLNLYRFVNLYLLNPYELKVFPFYYRNKKIDFRQFIGSANEIVVSTDIDQRRVDGSQRLQLIQFMQNHLSSSDLATLKLQTDAALLLPNSPDNNAGNPQDLASYLTVKKQLFRSMARKVEQEPQVHAGLMIQLLRLEKSAGQDLGYNMFRKGPVWDRLPRQDKVSVIIEEMKIEISEKNPTNLRGIESYYVDLDTIIYNIRRDLGIGAFDPIEYALKKIFEELQGKLPRPINMNEIEQMYFIMAYFKNALTVAQEQANTKSDFLGTIKAYKNVIELYNHFLPFMYDLDLDFLTEQEHDLVFLILFDHDIKSSLIELRNKARLAKLSSNDSLKIEEAYEEVVPYILTHNFADIEVVFKAVDKDTLEIFDFERTIEYQVFNFKFLYQVVESKQLNPKTFIDEAFTSFSGNLDLIDNVDDSIIWEYYFGDFRKKFFGKILENLPNRLKIKCVDDAIRKIIELSLRPLLDKKIKKYIEEVIKDPVGIFTEGFKNLETAAVMEQMWEAIVKKLAEEWAPESSYFIRYQKFYRNAMFEGEEYTFRPDIQKSYIEKFTREKRLANQRERFFSPLDSLKKAIQANAKKQPFDYFTSHRLAVVNLMRSTALGLTLPPGVPYICQYIYDNQVGNSGAVKAVDDQFWNDPKLFDLFDWIYDGYKRYKDVVDLHKLFYQQDASLHSYFVQSVHKYIEIREKQYVDTLRAINHRTQRRIDRIGSISQSLDEFQNGDESEILTTYGRLVDLRKGHNQKVEQRTKDKIKTVNAPEYERGEIKDFYYELKVDEGDVEKYAREWQYILCVLIPFSKYIGNRNLTLNSVQNLLNNQNIFKFYFFYFYRSYNNSVTTLYKYRQSYSGSNEGNVKKFFEKDLGFDYFNETYNTGQEEFYLNHRYVFKQIRSIVEQKPIMVNKFQSDCSYDGQSVQDMQRFYYKTKLPLFYEVAGEVERVASSGRVKKYLHLLYYVAHTFPYIAAYKLSLDNGKLHFLDKYEGDISSNSPTPFRQLRRCWQRMPAQYHCKEMLNATMGTIFLTQVYQVDLSEKSYEITTLPGLEFLLPYEDMRDQLNREQCLD